MVPQMLGIDFDWYSFYRGNFAPIALNERCSIYSFSLYLMHRIQGLDGNIFNSKQLGKYTESTEALVAFKLSIDLPQIKAFVRNIMIKTLKIFM